MIFFVFLRKFEEHEYYILYDGLYMMCRSFLSLEIGRESMLDDEIGKKECYEMQVEERTC